MVDDWSAFGMEDLARAERFLREVQPRLEDLRSHVTCHVTSNVTAIVTKTSVPASSVTGAGVQPGERAAVGWARDVCHVPRDERKDAKKEADEARRQLRALLKSLASGAEEAELGTRERIAALERRQARQDRRFDVATERARRCLQIKEEVEKLKRFIEQKLQEQRNRELVAARLLELKSLVNTGEKV